MLFSTALSFLSFFSFSQSVMPLDSVQHHVGKTVTVCSKVASSFVSKGTDKTCFLHLGRAYPASPLTLVVFNSALTQFSYEPSAFLKEKHICVQGKISVYHKVVQMVISSQSQITISEQ